MTDPDPIGADKRRARRSRPLPPDAACVYCGEQNPLLLRPVKRGVLEPHHPAGESNDPDLVVVLCLTHHQLNTMGQLAAGVDLERNHERTVLDRLVSLLRGLAVFFASLATSLVGWADRLAALIQVFDAQWPAWRALPQAQM